VTAATWITMIVILGFVWGGGAWALGRAMKSEAVKGE